MAFGEACRFKTRSDEPIGCIADGRRFHAGIFLGVDRRTGQYMLHESNSTNLTRTVLRMPEAEKSHKVAMSKTGCTPYDLHQPREPEVTLREKK